MSRGRYLEKANVPADRLFRRVSVDLPSASIPGLYGAIFREAHDGLEACFNKERKLVGLCLDRLSASFEFREFALSR